MDLAYLPSPSQGVVHLGPLPLRGYALCIIVGVVVAIWLGERRWAARGGRRGTIGDIAVWAVPFGLIGGRLYHVITTPGPYFGDGGDPLQAFQIWKGGLGIWGAIALGGVGAWIACRRRGIPLPAVGDAIAPGIALAQAVGRWGNWFNQELYGKATDVPWALKIDAEHSPDGVAGTYHPTFLYESLWCVGVAILVIWADRRFKLGHGRAFALYVAAYTAGRFWIEYMRIDEAEHVLGMRLNNWTSILVFAGAVAYIVVSAKLRPGREEPAVLRGTRPHPDDDAETAGGPGEDAGSGGNAQGAAEAGTQDAGKAEGAGKAGKTTGRTGQAGETGRTGKPDAGGAGLAADRDGSADGEGSADSGDTGDVGEPEDADAVDTGTKESATGSRSAGSTTPKRA